MLVFADYITWTVDPIAIHWPVEVRWYGLCFLACIFTCIAIMKPLFREIGRDPEEAVSVTIHVVIGIIVGSRLMHCFAYDPHLYLSDPIRIFKIWEGGLASHGGAIGALVAGYIWVNGLIYKAAAWLSPRSPEWLRVVGRILFGEPVYTPGMTYARGADIAAPAIVWAIIWIRFGNLMNHEVVGRVTDVPWAFIFTLYEKDPQPRHPAQIYEMIMGFVIFAVLAKVTWFSKRRHADGFRMALFFLLWFIGRFLVEFFKAHQSELVASGGGLTMGQYLSIPFVLIALPYCIKTWRRPPEQDEALERDRKMWEAWMAEHGSYSMAPAPRSEPAESEKAESAGASGDSERDSSGGSETSGKKSNKKASKKKKKNKKKR